MHIQHSNLTIRHWAIRACIAGFFALFFLAAPALNAASQTIPPEQAGGDDLATVPQATVNTVDEDSGPTALGVTLAITDVITFVSDPANGTATIINSGQDIEYQPDPDYCNSIPGGSFDTITYQINGDTATDLTIDMTVTCLNDPPTLSVPGPQTVVFQTEKKIGAMTVADKDIGAGNLRVTLAVTAGTIRVPTTAGVTIGGSTTAGVLLTGQIAAVNTALGNVFYTPAALFSGSDVLTVTADDQGNTGESSPNGTTVTKTVALNVGVAPNPDVRDDTATVNEDGAVDIPVLNNDVAGGNLSMKPDSVTKVSDPSNGGIQILPSGQIRYTPTANFSGTDSFDYRACNTGDRCGSATVTVTVNGVNDTPTIAPIGNITMIEGSQRTVSTQVNDIEDANAGLSVTAVSDNQTLLPNGNIAVNANGSQRNISMQLVANRTGVVNVTVTVTDSGSPAPVRSSATSFRIFVVAPDLSLTISDGGVSVRPGGIILYTLSYGNSGSGGAANTAILINVPANTTFVSSAGSNGWSCSNGASAGTACSLFLGAVPAGSTGNKTFAVRVNAGVSAAVSEISVSGRIGDDANQGSDTNPANNSGSDTTPIDRSVILRATKRDEPLPSDEDGITNPGDIIVYEVMLRNDGLTTAAGVVFSDAPDVNTSLVVGSVTTTQGAITSGNDAGQNAVAIELGELATDAAVTITFQVRINETEPAPTDVRNQGVFSGSNFPNVQTDDPDTPTVNDATVTPLGLRPVLKAFKTAALDGDTNGDNVPSPGETLLYSIRIANNGQAPATNVLFEDAPGQFTSLIVNTVAPSGPAAAVVRGNQSGDTDVAVNIPLLAAGETITVTFRVRIDATLPANQIEVENQGRVQSAELPTILTDDPATPQIDDPTRTTVATVPVLRFTKVDNYIDRDNNGESGPGDWIDYTIVLANTGAPVTDLVVTDPLMASLTLTPTVTGGDLVQVSRGIVTSGLNPDDRTIQVEIDGLGAGESATITFRVKIADTLPAGLLFVENQAGATANEVSNLISDDPDTQAVDDSTQTPVTAELLLRANLLALTASGAIKNGDILVYNPSIENRGNRAAANVRMRGELSPNTKLIVTRFGVAEETIISVDEESFEVLFPSLPAGQTLAFNFWVEIVGMAAGGTVENQFVVTADGLSEELVTDNPATPESPDSTSSQIMALIQVGVNWLPIIRTAPPATELIELE